MWLIEPMTDHATGPAQRRAPRCDQVPSHPSRAQGRAGDRGALAQRHQRLGRRWSDREPPALAGQLVFRRNDRGQGQGQSQGDHRRQDGVADGRQGSADRARARVGGYAVGGAEEGRAVQRRALLDRPHGRLIDIDCGCARHPYGPGANRRGRVYVRGRVRVARQGPSPRSGASLIA